MFPLGSWRAKLFVALFGKWLLGMQDMPPTPLVMWQNHS